MKKYDASFFAFILIFFLSTGLAQAVPRLIPFQGSVLDANGPINGPVNLVFKLYENPTPLAPFLWGEFHNGVQVDNGIYTVSLGGGSLLLGSPPFQSIDLSAPELWLEVTVNGAVMEPRQRVASVFYAMEADTVDGLNATDFAESTHTHSTLAAADGTPAEAVSVDNNGKVTLNELAIISGATDGHVLASDAAGNAVWTDLSEKLAIDDLTDGKRDPSNAYASLFLGDHAGWQDDGTNNRNTAVGNYALGSVATGVANTAVGNQALNASNGSANTALGFNSLHANSTGLSNVAVGSNTFSSNTTGNFNTVVGVAADLNNQTGQMNTVVGYQAGKGTGLHSKSGNVFLGHKAGYNETGSNKLYIENSDSSTPLIGGDFAAEEIYLNGKTVVGTPTTSVANTKFRVIADTDGSNAGRFENHNGVSATTYGSISVSVGDGGNQHYGVVGQASGAVTNYGVRGITSASGADENYGVYGSAASSTDNYGVYGSAAGGINSYGVYGKAVAGHTNYAGYFEGRTRVTGDLEVARLVYSAARTHTYTVPASAFRFAGPTPYAYFVNETEFGYAGSDNIAIVAPVHLPGNASLNTMTVHFRDDQLSAGWDLVIELHETTGNPPAAPGTSVIGSLTTSGATTGYRSKTYNFTNQVIDSSRAYTLKVYPQNNWLTQLTLVMVQFEYEISEAE